MDSPDQDALRWLQDELHEVWIEREALLAACRAYLVAFEAAQETAIESILMKTARVAMQDIVSLVQSRKAIPKEQP